MSEENESYTSRIFGNSSNFRARCFYNYKKLVPIIEHCKGLGLKMVLTQGTFDMVHIGHARYFEAAKKYGDFLVVGVDSDEKVRARKGSDRPVVPQEERLEMLTHMRSVDIVVLKELGMPKWSLIKAVRPAVLIATKDTYTPKQIKQLKRYCGKVAVLEPMATTSTSAKIRRLQIGIATKLASILTPKVRQAIDESLAEIKKES